HTTLTVSNSTFGGLSANPALPDQDRNILTPGRGGRGGNAATVSGGPTTAKGGNGGNGGNALGGGVYVNSGIAQFINDTIVTNEALTSVSFGGGGTSGGGTGSGITPGNPGIPGSAEGGGVYSAGAAGSTSFGNTIIDLNVAATSIALDAQ